jgi:hypothetical protein
VKDGNLSEDTIQKTEILMNSARLFSFTVILLLVLVGETYAQSDALRGSVSKEEILENDHIYEIYIDRYKPDSSAVKYLSALEDSVELIVFIGSWCRESKKYIPGLMKTLQVVGTDLISTEYIGVDQAKKFPEIFLKKYEIKYIPTVVALKGNKELGRIEEKPRQLIETDLVQILKSGNEKNE